MKNIQFERGSVRNIRVHVLPTDQFKTYAVSVYIGTPLQEETVTSTAFSPFVLRRGSQAYPETQKFRERLDDLYGAGFGFDIYKRGDYQMVQFRMDLIEDQFVNSAESLLEQGMRFAGEAITNPAKEDGRFVQKYVESEKVTLQKRIEAIVNDKIRYAAERCIEEMCKHEPYRLHPLGNIPALQAITANELYDRFQQWLHTSPIDVYVVGHTTLKQVMPIVEASFGVDRQAAGAYTTRPEHRAVEDVKVVVEKIDVNQGKLNMGLRAHTTYADQAYPTMLMYNGILGGYPHSKLFTNVREKASLAYYASSRFDGHKGILTIQSGIEIDNYDKAVDIIRKQLDALQAGDINDMEMQQTKAMISGHLRELQDSAFEIIAFDFNNILAGVERTVPSLIEEVNTVSKEQIQAAAEKVQLDTIYFLRDRKGGE
ncbi:EF-P 5-aminopentanol modification-associated protein YfmF [Paenibacillus xerothermodurans]|uniref:Insulinase family protein n=1 Tax=Paenibacillus xerothermodurans TaxID=1977292 RepID=A0A2W1P3U4_PAEXE|nr:pitrilysin family protein [Paenibacillus xerothermodurans]PZE22392.1 insulinase family protein [Paenibacillus xerothermodurans]